MTSTFTPTVIDYDLQTALTQRGPLCEVEIPNRICRLVRPVNFQAPCRIVGAGPGSTILVDFDGDTDAITLGAPGYAYNMDSSIEGVRILSTRADACRHVLVANRCHRLTTRRLRIGAGASGFALALHGCIWPDIEVTIGHLGEYAYVNQIPHSGIWIDELTSPPTQTNAGKLRCVISGCPGDGLLLGGGSFGSTQWEVSGTIEQIGETPVNVRKIKHLTLHDLYATDGNLGQLRFVDCQMLRLSQINAFTTGCEVVIDNCDGVIECCNLAKLSLSPSSRMAIGGTNVNEGRGLDDQGLTTYLTPAMQHYGGGANPWPYNPWGYSSPLPRELLTYSEALSLVANPITAGADHLTVDVADLVDRLDELRGQYVTAALMLRCSAYYSPMPYLEIRATAPSGDRFQPSFGIRSYVDSADTWARHIVSIYVPQDADGLMVRLYLPRNSVSEITGPTVRLGAGA